VEPEQPTVERPAADLAPSPALDAVEWGRLRLLTMLWRNATTGGWYNRGRQLRRLMLAHRAATARKRR